LNNLTAKQITIVSQALRPEAKAKGDGKRARLQPGVTAPKKSGLQARKCAGIGSTPSPRADEYANPSALAHKCWRTGFAWM
jgi:hypothetical protein